jgi:hypothetical protein
VLLATQIGEARLLEYVALRITAKAFRQRRKRKAGRRDKDLANSRVMNRLI